MPRRAAQPEYEDDRDYPAREAHDVRDLAEHLQAVVDTYAEAVQLAIEQPSTDDGSTPLERVEKCLRTGRQQSEQAHRLITEFALAPHGGAQTQRTAAGLLGISRSTAAYFHVTPLARDELTRLGQFAE